MASFGRPLDPDDMPVTPPPGASPNGMGGTRGVSDGRWDGGVARNTGIGETPSLPVTVRWDSALPIREALTRSQQNAADAILTRSGKDYVITVIGLAAGTVHPAGGQGDGTRGVEREPQDPAQIERGFIVNSELLPRGKAAITPEDAKFDSATGAVHLFFPRREPIAAGDKEVTFSTRFGSVTVRKKFRLKEMAYKGQLEL
jgi:hypothetical protein